MNGQRKRQILVKLANHGSVGRNLDYGGKESDGHDGEMFRQSMWTIMEDAKELHDALGDGDQLPQWCHYKAAEAAHHLASLRDHLIHKIEMGVQ